MDLACLSKPSTRRVNEGKDQDDPLQKQSTYTFTYARQPFFSRRRQTRLFQSQTGRSLNLIHFSTTRPQRA